MAQPQEELALLHQCLLGAQNAQPEIRTAAEQMLGAWAQRPGFAVLLAQLALSADQQAAGVPEASRQMALVLLKKFAKEHWDSSSRDFKPPECGEAEKAAVRQALPSGLGDSSSKVRTATAMVICAVAEHDYPHQWPGILEWMLQALWEPNPHLVQGVLRCLAMLVEDIDEQQLPKLVANLLPSLLRIMTSTTGQYPPHVRKHVLSILHGVLSQLGMIQGVYQRQVRDLLAPLLGDWIPVLAGLLAEPLTRDASSWPLKLSSLQVLVCLVSYFGKPLGAHIPGLLAPCWHMFTGSGRALYQEMLVVGGDNDAEGDDVAEDGESVGLEAVLSQMFELLLSLVGSPRFSKLLQPAMPELALVTMSYMQMTHQQEEEWADNPNTYVADEEDATCTARVSGELLLDELCRSHGLPAVLVTLEAVEKAIGQAEQARAAAAAQQQGQPAAAAAAGWWKLREAALLATGTVADALEDALSEGGGWQQLEAQVAGGPRGGRGRGRGSAAPTAAQAKGRLQALLDQILQQDLQGPQTNPFLAGRALWAAAKLASFMTPPQRDAFLLASCSGLQAALPAPVRIGACRALVRLLPLVARQQQQGVSQVLPSLYSGLVRLLGDSSEETLHLVLETLAAVVRNDKDAVITQYLGEVLNPVLHVWQRSVADPLIGEDAFSVLAALAAQPPCLVPLVSHLLPALVGVISAPKQQPPMMVEASLQLLRALIKRPTAATAAAQPAAGGAQPQPGAAAVGADAAAAQHAEVVRQVYVSCVVPVLALVDTADDSSIQQEAQQLLCQLVRCGRGALLAWAGGSASDSLARLLASAVRLLGPHVSETDGALAGHWVADMVRAFPSDLLEPHMPQLLKAVCERLVRVNYASLVAGLIIVLSHLVNANCSGLLHALTQFNITTADGREVRALDGVLPVWIERSHDVHGRYHTAVVVTALGALLEAGGPQLQQVQVCGKRLDIGGGVKTRSQLAAAGGEQYTRVPATVKVVAVLAQVLADAQEASRLDGHDEEEDDEYEEGEEEDEGEADESAGAEHGAAAEGLAVRGVPYASSAQGGGRVPHLEVLGVGAGGVGNAAHLHDMAAEHGGEFDGGGGPLSPSSVLHDEELLPGADTAAPPGDPLAKLDVGAWVSELFQRMALQPGGKTLLQASAELAMTERQAAAVQRLLSASRLSD